MKQKRFKVTYRLYKHGYQGVPEEISAVVSEDPWLYLERIKADLAMVRPDMHVGTYIVEEIKHLEVVK